jgi:hypothetical protein
VLPLAVERSLDFSVRSGVEKGSIPRRRVSIIPVIKLLLPSSDWITNIFRALGATLRIDGKTRLNKKQAEEKVSLSAAAFTLQEISF